MPMLFQPTTSLADLGQMNNVPVDMTLEGLNQYRQGQQADQMAMEDLPGLIQHQQNMRPLQEQSLAANSAATLAQIPGMQADARMKNVQADTAEKTQQSNIEALIAKHGHEKMQSYLDEVAGMGPLMQQAAAVVMTNPVGGSKIAKQMFERAGHGDMWSPMYDKMDQATLIDALQTQGRQINAAMPRMQQAVDVASLKAEYQARLEAAKIASRESIAAGHNQLKRDVSQAELAFKNEHQTPNYQQLSARYSELARQAYASGNSDYGQQLDQEAQRLDALAKQYAAIQGNINNQGKVDVTGLTGGAIPTLNPNRTATTTPGAQFPQRGGQQQQQTTPQTQYQQGKTYQGKTGNYQYLGGNPEDPKSWKKVD